MELGNLCTRFEDDVHDLAKHGLDSGGIRTGWSGGSGLGYEMTREGHGGPEKKRDGKRLKKWARIVIIS
jgi:hypothetical protein